MRVLQVDCAGAKAPRNDAAPVTGQSLGSAVL